MNNAHIETSINNGATAEETTIIGKMDTVNEMVTDCHPGTTDSSPNSLTNGDHEVLKQADEATGVAAKINGHHNTEAADRKDAEETTSVHAGGGEPKCNVALVVSTGAASQRTQKAKASEKWSPAQNIELVGTIKQSIENGVQQYVEEATPIFYFSTLPQAPEELDETPGAALQLSKSASSSTQFAFKQIIAGLKNLQSLANATEFDQHVFQEEVADTLKGWDQFFSAHFTDEVKLMIERMNALVKILASEQQQPESIAGKLSTRSEQVGVMLDKAVQLNEQIARSRSEVKQMRLAAEKRQAELSSREVGYLERIQELEAELAKTKQSLKTVQSLKEKYANFFTEEQTVSEAISTSCANLGLFVAKGNTLSKALHQRLQSAEGDDELPAARHL